MARTSPDPDPDHHGEADLGIVDALAQLSFLVQARLARHAALHEVSMVQTRLLGSCATANRPCRSWPDCSTRTNRA